MQASGLLSCALQVRRWVSHEKALGTREHVSDSLKDSTTGVCLKRLAFGALVACLAILAGCQSSTTIVPKPVFKQDLRSFGFPVEADGRIIGSYSDVTFLTDDLVLVTVNTRVYGIDESHSDFPASKLLLFDLRQKALLKLTEIPVEKTPGSVQATVNGHFALLNQMGVHLCSLDLACGRPVKSRGPLSVSPRGAKIAVGGNGKTEQILLDGATLAEISRFAWKDPTIIPGDNGLLAIEDNKLYVRLPQQPDKPFSFGGGGIWPEARFLSPNIVADFASDKILAVATTDGKILYRLSVNPRWDLMEIATSSSGSRFAFHTAGYTRLSSILNFFRPEPNRHFNLEQINVMECATGKSRFKMSWDPRPYVPYLTTPALSPDGHKVAMLRSGFLEVFDIR